MLTRIKQFNSEFDETGKKMNNLLLSQLVVNGTNDDESYYLAYSRTVYSYV